MVNNKALSLTKAFMGSVQLLVDTDPLDATRTLQILRDIGISPDSVNIEMCIEKLKALKFDQVFLINKFMETPLDSLVQGLRNKNEEDVKRYYRSVAKQLHPDKNAHPGAKEAFQKI